MDVLIGMGVGVGEHRPADTREPPLGPRIQIASG